MNIYIDSRGIEQSYVRMGISGFYIYDTEYYTLFQNNIITEESSLGFGGILLFLFKTLNAKFHNPSTFLRCAWTKAFLLIIDFYISNKCKTWNLNNM